MQDNGSKASVDRARSRSKGILLKLDSGFRVLLAREQAWIAEHEDRRVPRTNLMRDLMRAELSRRATARGEAIPHATPANFDVEPAGEDDETEGEPEDFVGEIVTERTKSNPEFTNLVASAETRRAARPQEPPPAPPQPSQEAPEPPAEPVDSLEALQAPPIAAQAAARPPAAPESPEVDPRAAIRADRLKRIEAAVQALKEKDIKKEPTLTARAKAEPTQVGRAEGRSGFVGDIKVVGASGAEVKRGE